MLLLLYGDVSMFLLLGLIGPPPTLRPESFNGKYGHVVKMSRQILPLDSLDDFPSPEFPFFVISFEYPEVVKSPAKVV